VYALSFIRQIGPSYKLMLALPLHVLALIGGGNIEYLSNILAHDRSQPHTYTRRYSRQNFRWRTRASTDVPHCKL